MQLQSVTDILAAFRPGMTVYLPGASGESLALYAALQQQPDAADGVCFTGFHFPGVNRSDYLGLHPRARQRGYAMSRGLRAGLADGRGELLPLDHPAIYRDLAEGVEIDVAVAQITPPDADGICSTGLSADFLPAVWHKAARRVAHVNPRLPRTHGSFTVHARDIDAAFEADETPLEYDTGEADAAMQAHAARVAELVRDGDTLEFGIGRLQAAILSALRGHRKLRIWSGMLSAPLGDLLDAGALDADRRIEGGVALGGDAFYRRLGQDERFYFRPVSETHDVRRIAAMPSFCAINSAVEVDLFGQVASDAVPGGRWQAGVGGLPPFVAGAQLSEGGRSIIVLPATSSDGRSSRIVARLSAGLVALPRHAADYVVTEHGVAALRGLSIHRRAEALTGIAAPQFRDALSKQWNTMAQEI